MSKDKKRRYGSAKENAEKRSSGSNYGYIKIPKDVKMFTPESDTTAVIDILPYEVTDKHNLDKIEEGTLWYKKLIKVHRYIGVNNDSVICPTTFGKPCPICEHGAELRKDSDADEKQIEKTKVKWRNIYAVKVREYDGKKQFDKDAIHLFDFSDPLFQKVFETQLKKKKEFDTFFLHDEGCSLELTFDEDSFGGNKYTKVTRVDFIQRKKQYKDEILDLVPKLDEVLVQMDYDDLEALFFGEQEDAANVADKKSDKKKDKKKDKDSKEEKSDKKKDKEKKKNSEPTTEQLVEDAEDVNELIDIIKTYPSTFGEFKKELKKIEKVKKLKARMLEIIKEANNGSGDEDDLPFNKTANKSEGGEKKKDKKKSKDECPYNHKFGKDCDKYDDCKDCDLWNECKAAKKAAKKDK